MIKVQFNSNIKGPGPVFTGKELLITCMRLYLGPGGVHGLALLPGLPNHNPGIRYKIIETGELYDYVTISNVEENEEKETNG